PDVTDAACGPTSLGPVWSAVKSLFETRSSPATGGSAPITNDAPLGGTASAMPGMSARLVTDVTSRKRAHEERTALAELGELRDFEHALAGATLHLGETRLVSEARHAVAFGRDLGGRERRDVRAPLGEERAKRSGREHAVAREVGRD